MAQSTPHSHRADSTVVFTAAITHNANMETEIDMGAQWELCFVTLFDEINEIILAYIFSN